LLFAKRLLTASNEPYLAAIKFMNTRFADKNFRLSDFYDEVCVVCPSCEKRAIAKANRDARLVRLFCVQCGYNKEVSAAFGKTGALVTAAHGYFDASLWLRARFRNNIVWAYNDKHLAYLKAYIGAGLREHKNRTHYTLLEKLPRFYHEARNREALRKVIERLEQKLN